MKRRLAVSLVFTAWQTGCTVPSSDVVTTASPLLDAEPSSATNVVAVRTERGVDGQLCTGTLLLPNLVLTARHCLTVARAAIDGGDCAAVVAVPDANTRITVIAAKDVDLAFDPQTYAVSEAWLPEDKGLLCGQDLALLYLAEPIHEQPLSVTVSLPKTGSRFTTYGYGLAEGDYGQQRRTTEATLLCLGKDCDDERLADNELLANSGACDGDSGGPAIDGKGTVFALASRSASDCSETAYVAFTDHFPWLAAATRKAAKKGKLDVPAWAALPAVTEVEDPATASPEATEPTLHATGGCTLGGSEPSSLGAVLALAFALLARALRRSAR